MRVWILLSYFSTSFKLQRLFLLWKLSHIKANPDHLYKALNILSGYYVQNFVGLTGLSFS